MTAKTRTALYAAFETGDIPQGSDYADLIDSSVNLLDTGNQAISGSLTVSGDVSAASVTTSSLSLTNLTASGTVSLGTTSVSTLTSSGAVTAPTATINNIVGVPVTLAGVGTTQAGAATITSSITRLATSVGQTAFVLPNTTGQMFFIHNTTATSALVYPPVGGTIDGGATDASITITYNSTKLIFATSSTEFWSV